MHPEGVGVHFVEEVLGSAASIEDEKPLLVFLPRSSGCTMSLTCSIATGLGPMFLTLSLTLVVSPSRIRTRSVVRRTSRSGLGSCGPQHREPKDDSQRDRDEDEGLHDEQATDEGRTAR